jgi:hypothetical protein
LAKRPSWRRADWCDRRRTGNERSPLSDIAIIDAGWIHQVRDYSTKYQKYNGEECHCNARRLPKELACQLGSRWLDACDDDIESAPSTTGRFSFCHNVPQRLISSIFTNDVREAEKFMSAAGLASQLV